MKNTWEKINTALVKQGWNGRRITNLIIEIARITPMTIIVSDETLNQALLELNIPTNKIANIFAEIKK